MLLHRLLIEFQADQRWVALSKEHADDQLSGFRLDDEFDTSDVVAAACATGWVVQREGECWISIETWSAFAGNGAGISPSRSR